MRFEPKDLDYQLSPYTGLTRKHWIDADKYMLEGIFKHIKSIEDPVIVPRYETEITYPNAGTPPWKVQAEIFEGLARSFFLAAPLIHIEKDVKVAGMPLREYYKKQVLRACTPGDSNFVLSYDEMENTEEPKETLNTYQQTVETCALVICLWMCKEEIWDTYAKEEKDVIASFLTPYAHKNTVPQNWRLFNMLDLAFLHMNGYPIDKGIMRHHAQVVLNYYTGDGWYRDGHGMDYYSAWAFQVYTPIWCRWYGYENEPYLAARFEENSNKLMESYPKMFDADGWVNMWGRSNIYRNAATSSFDGNFFFKNPTANPGLARRISSGALMQFLGRDDLMYEGVPTLGFYKSFLPLVQSYSCAESPFWMAKAFMCLHLPEDHPFWTAREENGVWDTMAAGETFETVLNGPGLCTANHKDNGTTEMRTGKVIRKRDDDNGLCCYAKLAYNTKYPWEASLGGWYESQMYLVHDKTFRTTKRPNALLWHGCREGVLYRRNFFHYDNEEEEHWLHCMNLADFSVAEGLVRVDKFRTFRGGLAVTLGSYGFPDNGDVQVRELEKDGAKAIVLKGLDSQGKEKQMAMTVFTAWESLKLIPGKGTNPDSEKSLIIGAEAFRKSLYAYEPFVFISQVITRESFEDFTEDEIFSIRKISFTDPENCGGYGPVTLEMKDGRTMTVDYLGMVGNLQI